MDESLQNRGEQFILTNSAVSRDSEIIRLLGRLSVGINLFILLRGTTASHMQNVKRDTLRNRILILGVILVQTLSQNRRFRETLGFTGQMENTWERSVAVVSFVSFLLGLSGVGKGFDLLDNIFCSQQPSIAEPTVQRASSFEFLSRLFITEGASKLGLLLLPLINFRKLFIDTRRRFFPFTEISDSCTCSVCDSETLVLPRKAIPCGDLYCFHCSQTFNNTVCARCSTPISAYEPFIS